MTDPDQQERCPVCGSNSPADRRLTTMVAMHPGFRRDGLSEYSAECGDPWHAPPLLSIWVTRDLIAASLRDWIHEQPFSKCYPGADTCPDWPLAYEIADRILRDD